MTTDIPHTPLADEAPQYPSPDTGKGEAADGSRPDQESPAMSALRQYLARLALHNRSNPWDAPILPGWGGKSADNWGEIGPSMIDMRPASFIVVPVFGACGTK